MRVLHVQKVAGIGGSEGHLLDLLPGLASRGVEVRMCVLASAGADRFTGAIREKGVEVVEIPAGQRANPAAIARLVGEMRRFRPDLVHTHLIHADVYGQAAARLLRLPAVSTLHSSNTFYRRPPYRSAARAAGRLARRTIAISEHVRRFATALRLAPPARIRVIPYGIRASEWLLPEPERARARADLGLAEGDVAVGVASRLFPHKGHDFLIGAVAQAVKEAPALRLFVAGDGPLREELENLARASLPEGACRFLGYVSGVRAFMAACDIFSFPSLPAFGEGFGLAALEAMAAGRPVVATAIDSLPEVVEDGHAGILVTPGATGELAAALTRLARDAGLRARLGSAAHERAASRFTIDRMLDDTLAVYGEVA